MVEAPKTRRRWLQFSLGTMFVVVTISAGWLGWELNIVRERRAALTWVRDYQVGYLLLEENWRKSENEAVIENLKVACPERVPPTRLLARSQTAGHPESSVAGVVEGLKVPPTRRR